jgi:predicted AlkP superfamily phosphohydrolase/phosphomutase
VKKVLMLGLDAADYDVVMALIGQGHLPNLKRIIDDGVSGRLATPATRYAGGVWPTFYTGQSVPWHGIFHNKTWRPETMQVEVPGDGWIAARPFWEKLSAAGIASCVVDVPMVLGRPRPINGICVLGWGTHDLICKGSWPADLWQNLERRFGSPRMPHEYYGRQSSQSLRRLSRQLLSTTDQLRDIALDLLSANPWQFGCIVFGAIHRAGHYLWDQSQIEGARSEDVSDMPGSALVGVYKSVDAAVGSIVEQQPEGALIVAFAAHGMGPNPGWSDLFPDILAKLEAHCTGAKPKRGLVFAMKQRVPHHWLRPLLTRLPGAVTDRLVPLWSRRMFDWQRTRYFPMPMDEAGYLRINLRGREARGIVEPGAEYEELCDRLEALVGSLQDELTGEPIAEQVIRAYSNADAAAPYRRLVPDLIVPWRGAGAANTARLVSNLLPGFAYDVPARLPSGRSGNHNGNAWFAASGPGVRSARLDAAHSILDLLPTVLEYLDVEPGGDLQGQAIPLGAAR